MLTGSAVIFGGWQFTPKVPQALEIILKSSVAWFEIRVRTLSYRA